MKLKRGADPVQFLKQVNLCKDDVLFCTEEGDIINLKSKLSQLVFAVAVEDAELTYSASIECKNEEDKEKIKAFTEE